MDPILLNKQLLENSADLQDYLKDIREWGAEMKRKDATLRSPQSSDEKRDLKIKTKDHKIKPTNRKSTDEKHDDVMAVKTPKDYKFWENFDVDAECEKVDQEKSDDSDLSDEYDESALEMALEEKEKGNELVKKGLYKEAIKCYSKAIEVYSYDATFFANRALCYLKLNQAKNAETDCTTALQIDNKYIKAYHRRATAREALGQIKEAQRDLQKVLELEPNNSESIKFLEKINKTLQENVKDEEPEERFETKFMQSRKKSEKPKAVTAPVIEAIKEHVYERKLPERTTSIVNKQKISWPAGDNVKLITPIIKAPKDRSKLPLKRLVVNENNQVEKIIVHQQKKTDLTQTDKKEVIQNKSEGKNEKVKTFDDLDITIDLSKEDFSKLNMAAPKTAVEFNNHWKILKGELKYLYLRQIQPQLYSNIFKESLDSKLFSDILVILVQEFISRNICVFNYLYGLTKVKRFTTLIMFTTSNDKKVLTNLFDGMKIDKKQEEIEYLKNLYEI